MNFFIKVLVVGILAVLLEMWLPWWGIAIGAFIIGMIDGGKKGLNFWAGFLGVFFVWAGFAYWIDMQTQSQLMLRISDLFTLPNVQLLVLLTGVIGGLVGGFSAWSGSLLKQLL